MTAKSSETTRQEPSVLDDVILHENDLTEEAKIHFTYHTDILNAFEGYRRRILQDKNLTPVSRHKLFSMLSDNHSKSKQVLNYMAKNSERLSRNLPPIGPVVICGLARTGTTLLYNLLACDPLCRAPSYTDMCIELTPPIARSDFIEQERRKALARPSLQSYTDKIDGTENSFESSHPMFVVEEDYFILCQAGFIISPFVMTLNDQSAFSDFLSDEMKKDFIYDYHETFLRMLNSIDAPSSHWLLKAPLHLLYLNTILRHYPNAALIMTHRNMNEVLPSFYRVLFNVAKMYSIETNSPHTEEAIMAQCTQFINKQIECLLKFRSTQSDKNVFDVNYDDLMKEPIHTVRRIYDHFSLKWSNEFEIAMESWLHDNPQGKRGRHNYRLDDFGLKQEDIDARYADYINLFLRSSSSDTTQ